MGILRFLLALAVAGRHAAGWFGFSAGWILSGNRAVQVFYVISGFLMAMILNGKYADTPRGNWLFYSNRILKIFVPYLVILAASVGVCLLSKLMTGNGLMLESWFAETGSMSLSTWAFALLTNIFIIGQEWGFLLIYRAGSLFYSLQAFSEPPIGSQFTVITPAWTLSIELMFYALAPFIVRRHILLIAGLALASCGFRFGAYRLGFYSEATNYRFFPFELSLFLYGALCFRLSTFLPKINAGWAVAITVAILTAVFIPGDLLKRQYQLYCLVGLVLPALFVFSQRNKWDRLLGDLSFPLYLVHWPIIAIAVALVRTVDPSSEAIAWPILATVFSVFVSILIDRYVVEPIDKRRQARIQADCHEHPAEQVQIVAGGPLSQRTVKT